MKKTYITPTTESVAFGTEGLVAGANSPTMGLYTQSDPGTEDLTNGRDFDDSWDDLGE